jgi:hypothetical protein
MATILKLPHQSPTQVSPESGTNQVQDNTSQDTQTTSGEGEGKNAPVVETSKGESMIVLDGPLSQIYTKALMVAYAKPEISTESAANDAIMAKGANDATDNAELLNHDAAYLYVTDDAHLTSDTIGETIDELNLGLNSAKYKTLAVCIEGCKDISRYHEYLTQMAENKGAKVFHTRKGAMDYLASIHG